MVDTQTLTLNISDLAQEKLREVVAAKGADVAVRVFAQGAGEGTARFGMALDGDQLADDTVLEFAGFKVFVDRESAEFVHDSEIDFQEGLMGAGFTLQNPHYSQASAGGCCGGHGGSGCGCQH
jgi:iron-sulfur cluster assembly accessory protein